MVLTDVYQNVIKVPQGVKYVHVGVKSSVAETNAVTYALRLLPLSPKPRQDQ